MSTERTLDTVWSEIEATFVVGIEAKWKRCLLYKEARAAHPSDKAFGAWLSGMALVSGRAEHVEKSTTRAHMINCATWLEKEEYLLLKSAKAEELMVRIEDFRHFKPVEWRALLDKTIEEGLTKAQVRSERNTLSEGMPKAPKPSKNKKESPAAKIKRLEAEIASLREAPETPAPAFVAGNFFSPLPEVRDIQERLLKQEFSYCAQLLELPMSATLEWTRQEINSAFRNVSRKYHPDHRGGEGAEDMQCVNYARDALIQRISVMAQLTNIRGE